MSNITIFEEPSSVPTVQRESRRMDRMSSGGGGSTMRRIQLSNGRTFKRVINGEQIGKAATDTLDVIIVDWLVEPSRKFYAAAYDKDAKATLPDCWSNDGVAPEAGASNKQSKACASCPKNVKGSGTGGKGKACRYERRLAVLVAGDPSGDIYQIAIPGASLFSDNDGNVYGFEGYKKFMLASKHALDTVVTRLIYDTEADTAKVGFKPIRHLTEMEASLVDAAQDDPATEKYTMLTVGAVDSAKAIAAPAPVVAIAAPTASVNPFGDDEDEDEAPATPVKRAAKPKVTPEVKPELASVMGEWLKEEEEEDDFA
jgi:hypothetical protein